MLDIKFIRGNPEKIKEAVQKRGMHFDVDFLLQSDERRRALIAERDSVRAGHNAISEEILRIEEGARAKKIKESKQMKEALIEAEKKVAAAEEEFNELMRRLPNIPFDDVPVGPDESANAVLREVGDKRAFPFTPKDYMDIAAGLGLIETERAAKVSGSRFGYLMRDAVLLEFALVRFAFDRALAKGFIPVVPPVLVREEIMRGMGYIDTQDDREERYVLENDKLFLVGTSEQSIGPMHADETFDVRDLPRRYIGFSTCFRREAGSYGKDTKGILRVHQFDKVEMFTIARPEDSPKEHELMLSIEEELMSSLGIPYRVVLLSTGDLSRPSAKTYDIEAWLPGQNNGAGQYRETHSTSNTTDFQARRLNVKYRTKDGGAEFVHMLNGTAFAIGRTIIAILENYQEEDGSVVVPNVLRPYMGGMERIVASG